MELYKYSDILNHCVPCFKMFLYLLNMLNGRKHLIQGPFLYTFLNKHRPMGMRENMRSINRHHSRAYTKSVTVHVSFGLSFDTDRGSYGALPQFSHILPLSKSLTGVKCNCHPYGYASFDSRNRPCRFLVNGLQLAKKKKVHSLHASAIKIYRVEAVGLKSANYT